MNNAEAITLAVGNMLDTINKAKEAQTALATMKEIAAMAESCGLNNPQWYHPQGAENFINSRFTPSWAKNFKVNNIIIRNGK